MYFCFFYRATACNCSRKGQLSNFILLSRAAAAAGPPHHRRAGKRPISRERRADWPTSSVGCDLGDGGDDDIATVRATSLLDKENKRKHVKKGNSVRCRVANINKGVANQTRSHNYSNARYCLGDHPQRQRQSKAKI